MKLGAQVSRRTRLNSNDCNSSIVILGIGICDNCRMIDVCPSINSDTSDATPTTTMVQFTESSERSLMTFDIWEVSDLSRMTLNSSNTINGETFAEKFASSYCTSYA